MMLHVSIMAHPSRRQRVQEHLLPRLAAQAHAARALGLEVVGPDLYEDDGEGITANRRRCLSESAEHTLVVQDDVEVCADFVEAALHLVHMHPDVVLALAPVAASELRAAHAMGRAWVELPVSEWTRYDGSPCSIMPQPVVRAVLDAGTDYPQDDALLSDVLSRTGARVLAPVPSIAAQDTRIASTKGGPSSKPVPPFVGVHERAPLAHYLRQRFTAGRAA